MSADVESQSAARPRGRCLDTFLITSVVALFVMFLAGLGGALLFVKHLESQMSARRTPVSSGQVGDILSQNSYKVCLRTYVVFSIYLSLFVKKIILEPIITRKVFCLTLFM